jgi:hypothetical protein
VTVREPCRCLAIYQLEALAALTEPRLPCPMLPAVSGDSLPDVVYASSDRVGWFRNEGGSPVVWTAFVIATAAVSSVKSLQVVDMDGTSRSAPL